MTSPEFLPLFIIFVIAWMVPLLLSWLEIGKLPAVIAEIIMGVIVGPYVLGLVESSVYLDFLAEMGFLFLIFLAGLEIDVHKIISSFPRGRIKFVDLISNSFLLAVFIYFGSLALSFPFAWLVSHFIDINVIFFTFLMPTVALSIIVPILKADGELTRKYGQVLLMEGAIATIMSIILISVYAGYLRNGLKVELLLFTLIFLAFAITYIVGKRMVRVRTFQKLLYRLEHAASQIRVRGTVALLLFFVIIAILIDTEPVMGAFFSGTLLSLFVTKQRSALLFKLDGMSYGFFIPIFFIMVGVNLDLSALTHFGESIPFILTLTVGFFLTQIIPAVVMARIFGLKKALAGGTLLTARLGLTIAAAQIGLSLNIISTAENAGIVTSSIVASLLSPLIYKALSGDGELVRHIYILGGSRASLYLSERFKMHGSSFMTLIEEKHVTPEFEEKSIPFRLVERLDTSALDKLDLHTSDQVIVITGSVSLNQKLTKYITNNLNHEKVITQKARTLKDEINPKAALKFVDQDEVVAHHLEDMILRPNTVNSLSESFGVYRIEEIIVTRKDVHRKQVKDVAFPASGSLVIQRRDGEIFIPHGDTRLLTGDIITVIGNAAALAEFRRLLENE
ncbi:cation:proton antiporter [Fulvivirgaceae bacterium BMA10]|uniref:Cation:proton antiporter n=1 Tax=Splendidivirga corallicola TaxID=3051826 RepID=A0ABT8KP79_9BACT|nr:cation:proton antiporter [Fulvivirgaceae bacterium BMA10]